ncbi:MAG: hypothetical protein NTX15_10630 [Candidatus Kapabacteria bacterium]|nr:hypothetical protein [Candidatus Kapabacteria bacterium]
MRRLITAIVSFAALVSMASAGISITIIPTPRHANVDGATGATVKLMPAGGEFLLTVNKGQDVSFYRIQWFKDGVMIPNETGQDLKYPIASAEMNGVYTVKMASPCATVESNPIRVTVERRAFQVNSQIGNDQGVAGTNGTTTSAFELKDVSPNPVHESAMVGFTTRETAMVTVRIVDLVGNVVATVVNDVLPAGDHSVTINTKDSNMSSALYYVVMSAPGFTDTKPLMLAK